MYSQINFNQHEIIIHLPKITTNQSEILLEKFKPTNLESIPQLCLKSLRIHR